MQNAEIVFYGAIGAGIYTRAEAAALAAENGGYLPLYTYKEWKARGYHVKRGEHAILSLPLWIYTAPKKTEGDDDGEKAPRRRFRLKKSHLFGPSQVEPDAPAADIPADDTPADAADIDYLDFTRPVNGHTEDEKEKILRQAAEYIMDYNWSLKKTADNMMLSAATLHRWIWYDLEFIDFDLYSDVTKRLKNRRICK